MPQRLLHKAQVLTKRISLNHNLDFSQITQTSLRGVGESSQRIMGWVLSLVEPAASKGRRGKLLYLPPKSSRWKLANRNWNIWNLNYSCYSLNRTLRFGKPEHSIFLGLKRCVVFEVIVFHSSHLGFWVMLSVEILLAILVVSLMIEWQHILKIKYKI
jgi:hypothetical protein